MKEIAKIEKSKDEVVVLVDRGEGYYERFVTWIQDTKGNNFWGHYFTDPLLARVDFADRAGINGNR